MSINVKHILFGEKQAKKPPALVAVTPHRTGERTLLGVENLLQSIAVPEPFSLELAGDMDGVTLLARCQDDRVVKQQLAAHYPQARVREVAPEDDPMRRRQGELAWELTLRVDGPEYVPLRTFRDDDLLDPGSAPCWRSSAPCPPCAPASASFPACCCVPLVPSGPSPTRPRPIIRPSRNPETPPTPTRPGPSRWTG